MEDPMLEESSYTYTVKTVKKRRIEPEKVKYPLVTTDPMLEESSYTVKTVKKRRIEPEPEKVKYPLVTTDPMLEECISTEKTINDEPEKDKYCFVLNKDYGRNEFSIYKVDTGKSTKSVQSLSPVITTRFSDFLLNFAFFAVGPKFYIIGGRRRYEDFVGKSDVYSLDTSNDFVGKSDVYSLDTSNEEHPLTWQKEERHMLANRFYPNVVAAGGKVYVFGTYFGSGIPIPWGEVFDPEQNLWSALPDPPPLVSKPTSCWITFAVLDSDSKILVNVRRGHLYSFDTKKLVWCRIDNSLINRNESRLLTTGTSLDDKMFVFSYGKVFAYDLVGNKWFEKTVQDIGISSPHDDQVLGRVAAIGKNSLCAVWVDLVVSDKSKDADANDDFMLLHCVVFRVALVGNNLHAIVERRSAYRFPGFMLKCCFSI